MILLCRQLTGLFVAKTPVCPANASVDTVLRRWLLPSCGRGYRPTQLRTVRARQMPRPLHF